MPDPIQLPEGVELWTYAAIKGDGNWHHGFHQNTKFVLFAQIPAIIAQELEKWEAEKAAELALLGVGKCSGNGIGLHNARAEQAEAQVYSPYCTEGCHLAAAETCGHSRQTWREVAERNGKAAGERRGEGRADFLRAERAEAERDDIRIRADDRLERLDKAEERVEALHHELRQAKAQALAELREAVEGPLRALVKGPTRVESQEARGLVEQAQELAQDALDALSTLEQENEDG